jgi:hypothetical protein
MSDPKAVYKYSKMIRRTDESVMNVFRNNIHVVSEDGKSFPVPVLWSSKDKIQETATHPDSIRLPLIGIFNTRIVPELDPEFERSETDPIQVSIRYHVTDYVVYREDANQIMEQVLLMIAKPVYFDQGDGWMTKIHLTHIDTHGVGWEKTQYAGEKPCAQLKVSQDVFTIYAEVNYKRSESLK